MDFSSGAFLVVTKLGFDHRGRLDVGKKLNLRFKIFRCLGACCPPEVTAERAVWF
jgi:hypothetical protein